MKYFMIFLALVGLFTTIASENNSAYGLWVPQSPEELMEQSDTVFVGTITSENVIDIKHERNVGTEREDGIYERTTEIITIPLEEYVVQVEEYLKNPQDTMTMKVLEATVSGGPRGPSSIGGFETGDRVLFYVPKTDGTTNQYAPESFNIPKQCDAKTVLEQPRIDFANDFKIMQDGTTKKDHIFDAGKPIQFVYQKDLRDLDERSFDFNIAVRKTADGSGKYDNQISLSENIHAKSNKCEWIATAKAEFVPQPGEYTIWISVTEDTGTRDTSGGLDFSVRDNNNAATMLEPNTVSQLSSPLKQFKSGVSLDEIECKESLTLVTKNNGFPACVKEQTVLKLIERGLIITSKAERDLMLAAGYKLYTSGWIHQEDQKNTMYPEPASLSMTDRNLVDTNNKLREIYRINPSLGPFYFQDVIVGHGIGDGYLMVDVLDKFYDSVDDRKLIMKKIVEITNEKVDIEFTPSYGITPIDTESIFQYVWNESLHKNHIQFIPQERSYVNTDEGYYYEKDNKVCSPLVSPNGTEFYISSTFTHEPFKITGTFIDKIKPDDCQKIWKTDVVLLEPDRILGLWLNDFFSDSRNNVLFTDYSAFLGYYIPDICTDEMVKFLKNNSDIFDNDMPYMSPLDGDVLDFDVNPDDMIQCENDLLEYRNKDPSWNKNED